MAIRPFWLKANWTGKKGPVTGGPQRLDGTIDITIKVREEGMISDKVLKVQGYQKGGDLVLQAWINDGERGVKPLPQHGQIELRVPRDKED